MTLVDTEHKDGAIWLYLNRPARHNALTQPLLDELFAEIRLAEAKKPAALVLSARGRSFSTGGDINGFLDHAGSQDQLVSYADKLVGSLHDIILSLIAFSSPVLAAVGGPVTGGSTGLVLAADMVALSKSAFIQPYYSEVGFAPDGGWTALMPEKIGTAKALEIQYLNTRISAEEAQRFGLATNVCAPSDVEPKIAEWVTGISRRFPQTHVATRQNVWDEPRRQLVKERLDREKARFLDLIARPETLAGMQEFTKQSA
jgi:2-(1,2-epoxy-1,2-dihydrophenyl)acetyl-CoA isomerase